MLRLTLARLVRLVRLKVEAGPKSSSRSSNSGRRRSALRSGSVMQIRLELAALLE